MNARADLRGPGRRPRTTKANACVAIAEHPIVGGSGPPSRGQLTGPDESTPTHPASLRYGIIPMGVPWDGGRRRGSGTTRSIAASISLNAPAISPKATVNNGSRWLKLMTTQRPP